MDDIGDDDDARCSRAFDLYEEGRHEEAIGLMRKTAQAGSLFAAKSLGDWLTEVDSPDWEEGLQWLVLAADGGDADAAWNLAMNARLDDDRDEYLSWMRRAAAMEYPEAVAVLAVIDRKQAEGRPWPMYIYAEVDHDCVWGMIQTYQDGEMGEEAMRDWALGVHHRQSAITLERHRGLARIVAELAGITGPPLTQTRAAELVFKLSILFPES